HLDDGTQRPDGLAVTEQVLAGAASSPNVGAALIIGVSEETGEAARIAETARHLAPGKPIEHLAIYQAGGSLQAISRGGDLARRLRAAMGFPQRQEFPLAQLVMAAECGGSDSTSGMASNPTVGVVSDMVVDAGGTVMFSETTELMGAEH